MNPYIATFRHFDKLHRSNKIQGLLTYQFEHSCCTSMPALLHQSTSLVHLGQPLLEQQPPEHLGQPLLEQQTPERYHAVSPPSKFPEIRLHFLSL